MKLPLYEMFTTAVNLPFDDAVRYLQVHDNTGIRIVAELAFKPFVWDLPSGAPPYTPCPFEGTKFALYSELKRLYLFIENAIPGVHPRIPRRRKEELFVQMLETIHPLDALLLIALKDRNVPAEAVTKFATAYPNLDLPPYEAKKEVDKTEVATDNVEDVVVPVKKKIVRKVKTLPAYDIETEQKIQVRMEEYQANKGRYLSLNSAKYKEIKRAKEAEVTNNG